jgi:radical SAM/Cys-rich protein
VGRVLPTLAKARAPLASAAAQRRVLAGVPLTRSFGEALAGAGLFPLTTRPVEILQLNLGKRCNQTCAHCHVDAGPDRVEVMPRDVLEASLAFFERSGIPNLDITGGAPELHPDFREIVIRATGLGRRVMHRCNLTAVLLPNFADIPALLAAHAVEVVASLPYFRARETDQQRGAGVFEESLEALRRLNRHGYGCGNGLVLNLVTNPVGTFLPAEQRSLEARWKQQLLARYGIVFDRLFTITNMPISRFLDFLERHGRTAEYLQRLGAAFNPAAAAGVMCRTTLSVAWDGTLYDCDFNQMLELPVAGPGPRTIFEASREALEGRAIATGPHCYGCTAGAGSSCGGAIA